MANKIISTKLREARRAAGLRQRDVYEWLGIGQSTFSAWETGQGEPSVEVFLRLCLKYGIKDITTYFLPDVLSPYGSQQLDPSFVNKFLSLSERSKMAVENCLNFECGNPSEVKASIKKLRPIPLYTQVATAGRGNYLDDPDAEVITAEAPLDADFAIRISGDSMEPLIHNDEIVFVRSCSEIQPGEIGIFTYNGESFCKIWDKRNSVPKLVSINSAKYPPIFLNKSDSLITHGKVLL